MKRGRLEAFSDGVLAIIITIMVLELKVPHGGDYFDLLPLMPVFLSYMLSFIYIGIYWSNHHHLIHTVDRVNGSILWANLHLLFWLSLMPFATGWLGDHYDDDSPVILYNFILMMSAIAYYILSLTIIKQANKDSLLLKAIGKDYKGKVSLVLYVISIPIALFNHWISLSFSVIVAFIWLIPDKRIEKVLSEMD